MAFVFTWNATFNTQPADSENANLGASRIRDTRSAVAERLVVDHSWAGDANDGIHLKVTMPAQGADPATVASTGYAYTKAVSGTTELFYKDSAGNIQQITKTGGINFPATISANVTGNAGTVTNGLYTTNIGTLVPSPTGTGASGNWNINVTGSAGTAGTATNLSGGSVAATTISASGNATFSGTTTMNGPLQTNYIAFSLVTWSAGSYTVAATDHTIVVTGGTGIITLPSAAANPGRELHIVSTTGAAVQSASNNVIPLAGGAAGNSVLSAGGGKFATLQSNATNWQIIMAN